MLTVLRHLVVGNVTSFDLEVLRGLTGLGHLKLEDVEFVGDDVTLSVLTALTGLQHLNLPVLNPETMHSSADVAAATTSSHLTYLDILGSFYGPRQHTALSSGGKKLLQLHELRINLDMMDHRAARLASSCCPNLQRLRLGSSMEAAFDEADLDREARGLASMLKRWRPVKSLTSLVMLAGFYPMDASVWKALEPDAALQHAADIGQPFLPTWHAAPT